MALPSGEPLSAAVPHVQAPQVALPWGAWYADTTERWSLPTTWQVDTLLPAPRGALSLDAQREALRHPVGTPPLAELARGRKNACIIVDDLARPTKTAELLPLVIAELQAGGLTREQLTILVATGTHGGIGRQQLCWKLGADLVANYRVEVHDARRDLAPTGIMYGNRELQVNRTFLQSDLKLGIGAILPHSFAGYSGGAKIVLPGLVDVAATQRSHSFVQLGLRGGQDPNANKFRLEIESLAKQLGLAFVICVVPGIHRETQGLVAGDVVAAHRAACEVAATCYATPLTRTYDAIVLNAYPKDMDVLQAENAFVCLKSLKSRPVHDGGLYVLATAASEGLGKHGLFEPGGVSYREPRALRSVGGQELWLYAPTLSPRTAHQLFWSGYRFFNTQTDLTAALAQRLPPHARLAVVPAGPVQQLVDRRVAVQEESK